MARFGHERGFEGCCWKIGMEREMGPKGMSVGLEKGGVVVVEWAGLICDLDWVGLTCMWERRGFGAEGWRV